MGAPFFTVIIPTYNRAERLSDAIQSIVDQTFSDWELIIVDDGSTDNSATVVHNFIDSRIKYIYQKNQERSVARNTGINNSTGIYICFLDSDDYYLINRLQMLYNEIQYLNNPTAFLYTGIRFNAKNIITPRPEIDNNFNNKYDLILNAIIGVPQVCIHSAILKEHQFNPAFFIGEDIELWLRIITYFPLIYIPNQYTVVANVHDDRSVNEVRFNPGNEQLYLLKYIFKKGHAGYKVSRKTKKESRCNTYFSISRHYIYNNKKRLAIKYLLLSILHKIMHLQTKHKISLILKLLINANTEYSTLQ